MKKGNKLHLVVAEMPPLPHSQPDGSFDIMKSEAAAWLANNPEVRNWLFQTIYKAGFIRYDKLTSTWAGVPTER